MPKKNIKTVSFLLFSFLLISCQDATVNPSKLTPVPKEIKVEKASLVEIDTDNTKIEDLDTKSIFDLVNNSGFFPLELDSDSLEATVPNNGGVIFATVPNNGGVIFAAPETDSFTTKALFSDGPLKEQLSKRKERLQKLKAELPEKWGKKNLLKPKRKVKIKFNPERTEAEVTVTTVYQRKILISALKEDFARDNITENSLISAFFQKKENVWNLAKISPVETASEGSSGLTLDEIEIETVFAEKDSLPLKRKFGKDGLFSKENVESFSDDDIIRVSVKATNTDQTFNPPVQVFANISGTKLRFPLHDDGSKDDLFSDLKGEQKSGDLSESDDIYTGSLSTKKLKKGLYYLNIQVFDAGSFEKNTRQYKSISKSLPLQIR